MKRLLSLFLLFFLAACDPVGDQIGMSQMMGYVPIYAARDATTAIATEGVRATTQPGKIYAYGNYLFQVEQYEGIHIVDNRQPKEATKIAFLKVPMATEIAIKAGHLYTNNVNDLVVFSLANITAPQLVHRIKDAFPVIDQTYPPFTNTFFECPDPAKGVVVGWEQKALDNPKCRR